MIKPSIKKDEIEREFRVRWYGVEEYYKNKHLKENILDSLLKCEEITNLKESINLSKEETFLRLIHRDFTLIRQLSTKILINPLKFKNTEIKEEIKSNPKTKSRISENQSLNRLIKKNKIDNENLKLKTTIFSIDSLNNDYHNLSLIDRKSSVVSSLINGISFNNEELKISRSNNLNKISKKICPDLVDKPSGETLVGLFVKEFHLKTKLSSEFELHNENIYKFSIKNDNIIYKMLKKYINILPTNFINLINNVKKSEKLPELNKQKDDTFDKDLFFYTSLSSNYNNIMEEMTRDITELFVFYYPLFSVTFDFVKPLNDLVQEINELKLKNEIIELNNNIKGNKEAPGSSVRWKMMDFICSAEQNYTLLLLLSNYCGYWLNNILKSLFSSYSSIREESCLVLAYMLTRPLLMNELMRNKQYDVLYDMVVILLRAIEKYSENISSFYCIIGYILQICSNVEIMDYIIDIGPYFKNSFLQKIWPRLLYYALKYWPKIYFDEKPVLLRKMLDILQQMILERKAKKMSTLTLFFLCKKFVLYPVSLTVWFNPIEDKNV